QESLYLGGEESDYRTHGSLRVLLYCVKAASVVCCTVDEIELGCERLHASQVFRTVGNHTVTLAPIQSSAAERVGRCETYGPAWVHVVVGQLVNGNIVADQKVVFGSRTGIVGCVEQR